MAGSGSMIKILKVGAEIIMENGFRSTGIQRVLGKAGIPKGSFYHYFKNKEDFGLHIVDYHTGALLARIEDSLGRDGVPPLTRLRGFFTGLRADLEENGFRGGSPLGNLAMETAGQSRGFRERLSPVFEAMGDEVEKCLQEAINNNELNASLDARAAADFIINSWEGAVMRMKVEKGPGPLENFERMIFSVLLAKP